MFISRRRTLSEGEGLLGYSPNRKPSILTPDAPEFVPRWLKDSPSSDGPPASAPIIGDGGHNNHNNNNNNHHKNRSRSMGGGFNQLNHFPPHSAPLAGRGGLFYWFRSVRIENRNDRTLITELERWNGVGMERRLLLKFVRRG